MRPAFTDNRTEYLETIAARIDAQAKHQYEYATENTDYADPLFYSDWEIDVSHVEPETAELITEFKALAGKAWKDDLKGLCDVEMIHGMHRVDDEISSFNLGEMEEQLDDAVQTELNALTDDEFKFVCSSLRECFMHDDRKHGSGSVYINGNYDRWSLVVDADRLIEATADLKSSV
jgi:hypothetical protein